MGASSSKSVIDIYSKSIVKVLTKIDISSSQAVSGKIEIIGSRVEGGSIKNIVEGIQSSFVNAKIDNKLINEMIADAEQSAKAESVPLSAAISENRADIKKILERTINNNFISKCAQSAKGSISIIGSDVKDVAIENVIKALQECTHTMLNNNGDFTKMADKLDQTATSETSFFGLGGIFSIIMLIVFILLIGGVGYYLYQQNQEE
jgi:hypothetical protein